MVTRLLFEDQLEQMEPDIFQANVEGQTQPVAQPEILMPVQQVQTQANRLDLQSLVTPEDAANIRMASDIGAAYPIVRGSEVYSFNPDGSVEYTRMNPGGIGATIGLYSSTGEEIVPQYYNADFGKTSTATRLLQAGLAAGIGGILGPAGAGLLSAPVAAATGAGLTSYGVTGDLESALKAAALGGATAFGIETLFPTAVQTAANTAVDLAGTGASQTEIVNALVDQGVRAGTAAQMAGDALAGATARQIATDFAGASIGGTAAGATSLAPNVVEVLGSTAAPGLLATAAPSLAGAAGGLLGTQVPAQQAPAVAAQTVPVQSTAAPVETQVSAPVAAATGGLLAPMQTVPVQAATTPAQTQATAPAAAAVGGLLAPTQTVPVQATNIPAQTQATAPTAAAVGTLAPTQTVQVEDRPIKREEAQILTPVAAGTVAGVPVADVAVPRSSTGPIEGSTSINPLAAAGLLALGASALTGGGSTGAPVDQAAYDAIARGRSPVYPRGDFTPMFGPGGAGMFQIAPTDVYNYFGPYYGAGRFGATVQPFSLPGLLGPNMTIPSSPSRASSLASLVGSGGF